MNEVGRGRSPPAEIHRASLGTGFGVGTRVLSGSDSDDPAAAVLSPFPLAAAGGEPFRFDALGRGAFEPARRPGFLFAADFFAAFPFAFFATRDLVREDFFAAAFFFVAFLATFVFRAAAFFETALRAFERAGFFRAGALRAGFFRAGALRAGFFRAGALRAGFFRAGFFALTFRPAFDFFDAVPPRRAGPFRVFAAFFLAAARFVAGFFLVAGFRLREVEADFFVARPELDLRPFGLDDVCRAVRRVVFADELLFRDFFAVLDRVPPELRVLPFLVAIELPAPVRRPLGSGLGAF